jgi:hypothetical protein
MSMIKRLIFRLRCPRQYWESRADALREGDGWVVGRTDIYSYHGGDGQYFHCAYPPNGERVEFRGSPVSALRRAVRYAERRSRKERA